MNMVKIPPYLQPGDTIGIVCPAGYISSEKVQACIDALRAWGYHVKTGMTVGSDSNNYFSAPDQQRLNDLQEMLNDDRIHAVLCARGGYGLTRIIDRINFTLFTLHPKWIIGFSDITLLHSHVYANFGIATLHAPMAGAFNGEDPENAYLLSLRKALEGKKISYVVPSHDLNVRGEAVGELVGGNLAMLAHAVGTSSDMKTKGRILFLEDVGEYLYNIDRMMYQLKRAGKFDKLAGLIVGGFTNSKDTERPFGADAYQIIKEIISEYDFPVCFDFPVGHIRENYALKTGIGYKLKVGRKKAALNE